MTEIDRELPVICPTCESTYLGAVIEGVSVFRCRKCKVKYKASVVLVCESKVVIEPLEVTEKAVEIETASV